MVNKEQRNSHKIALSGILAVFVVLSLYLTLLLPVNDLFFYGLSSVFVAIIIIELGVKAGFLFFLGTSLLALFLIPAKLKVIPYLCLLGHYGIWKWYLENKLPIFWEFIAKFIILNLGLLAVYFIYRYLFLANLIFKFDLRIIWLLFQPVFIIYDYAYSVCIRFYLKRIKPIINY